VSQKRNLHQINIILRKAVEDDMLSGLINRPDFSYIVDFIGFAASFFNVFHGQAMKHIILL
jgi:hypothetical protein